MKPAKKSKTTFRYPANQVINNLIEGIHTRKTIETMDDNTKEDTQKSAAYLDLMMGYYYDYDKHVVSVVVTPEDIREVMGERYDAMDEKQKAKLNKHALLHKKRVFSETLAFRSLLEHQQRIMQSYSEQTAKDFEELQERLDQ
jgi:hypothetical protein